ncbi:MAG: cysteine desulfurase family protein [Rhizobiaceae bacterium]
MSRPRAYLDWNATAPLHPEARAALLAALNAGGNASSVHAEGRGARAVTESARRSVAALCGADPANVTFTSGATEAATFALTPDWRLGPAIARFSHLYVCATDHPCLLSGGRFAPDAVTKIGVDGQGVIRLDALEMALAGHEGALGLPLVAVHLANNETGLVQPAAKIAALVHKAGGILILDASQCGGRIDCDITKTCADFLILSSHKIGGAPGSGALVGKSDLLRPAPLISGGGQEKGRRAGTENLPGIASFGAAADAALADLRRAGELKAMRDRFEAAVLAVAPDAIVHSSAADRLPNTLFFSMPGLKAETAQIAFDLGGVALSAGSACSSGKVGASHVLKAMGAAGEGALRVSIGLSTTEADLSAFSAVLSELAAKRKIGRAA